MSCPSRGQGPARRPEFRQLTLTLCNLELPMKVKIKTAEIKKLRKQSGWTQEALAEQAQLHPRTIQRMESEGLVSHKSLNAVANSLGVEAYSLEYMTDEIDFQPVLNELRILLLAITRRLIPNDDRDLPNSLVAVLTLLSFSASYTLANGIVTILNQPDKNFDSLATSGLFGLVILFCLIYAGVVYPLFKLRTWARQAMLAICYIFLAINSALLITELFTTEVRDGSKIFEYVLNLIVVLWIYRILNRGEVKRLYQPLKLPDT